MNAGVLVKILLMVIGGVAVPATMSGAWGQSAESLARRGNAYYKQNNFQQAADAYRQALIRQPENSTIKYNLGTALAKAGKTDEAQKELTQAAEAPVAPRRTDALYNKGVALGEAGMKKPEAAAGGAPQAPAPPDQATMQKQIATLEESLGSFRKAILTNSKDDDARYNYETVQDELRLMRQQMQQQKQQQGDKNQKQQNGQDKQQQNQQPQNGQDKQQQQQGKQQQQGGQNPQQAGKDDKGQTGGEDKGKLKAEQIDALGLLNLLEAEKPDQFKQLFKFRGGDTTKHPQRNW